MKLLNPTRRPVLKAVGIGTVLGLAVIALYALLVVLGANIDGAANAAAQKRELGSVLPVVLFVVLAPMVETILMAGVLEAGRRLLPWTAGAVVLVATLAHGGRGWFALAVILVFGVLTAQYLAYRERLGWTGAAVGVFVAHATVNALGMSVAAIAG